jgi:hypothetical protein
MSFSTQLIVANAMAENIIASPTKKSLIIKPSTVPTHILCFQTEGEAEKENNNQQTTNEPAKKNKKLWKPTPPLLLLLLPLLLASPTSMTFQTQSWKIFYATYPLTVGFQWFVRRNDCKKLGRNRSTQIKKLGFVFDG